MERQMSSTGRPPKEKAEKHPLYGQFNGDVPWLDGCKEYQRDTCLDCPVPLEKLEKCVAENPHLHKGGRPGRKQEDKA
jgi:hypothetical protein